MRLWRKPCRRRHRARRTKSRIWSQGKQKKKKQKKKRYARPRRQDTKRNKNQNQIRSQINLISPKQNMRQSHFITLGRRKSYPGKDRLSWLGGGHKGKLPHPRGNYKKRIKQRRGKVLLKCWKNLEKDNKSLMRFPGGQRFLMLMSQSKIL